MAVKRTTGKTRKARGTRGSKPAPPIRLAVPHRDGSSVETTPQELKAILRQYSTIVLLRLLKEVVELLIHERHWLDVPLPPVKGKNA